MSDRGSVINVGMPVAKIGMHESDDKLHAVIFLSSNDGKKINLKQKDSIEVLVSPVTIKPQEFGYIKGHVRYISEYPSSRQGMMRILKNELMVNLLSQQGAPFEMYVELNENSDNNNNGFYWTSGNGPEMDIYAGTPCFALTTIMEQRPITLVLPALKDFFKIY
jgi:HlyD family secretion protein